MLHYSVPYAYWLLSLTASSYHYHQTLPAYFHAPIRYSGESDNSEIRLARVLHRNGQRKTTAAVRLWSRNSRNFVNNTATENQQRRMAGWELALHQRELIAAAILDVTLTYYRGTGALNTLPAPEELFNEGTSRPQILSAQTQLALPFQLGQQKLRYNLMARAQWNQTPLIPQDRFAIGGRYTVRGFDGESSLIAERGYLVRNDLTVNLGHSGQELYLGLDYGDIDGPSSQFQLGKRLIGGVLGLRGSFKKLTYDAFIGRPFKSPEYFPAPATVVGLSASYQY
jgi:hemolysin activation/secretion protein